MLFSAPAPHDQHSAAPPRWDEAPAEAGNGAALPYNVIGTVRHGLPFPEMMPMIRYLTFLLLALPCAAQVPTQIDDGEPHPNEVWAGPTVDDSNPAYWTGPYGESSMLFPAWPFPPHPVTGAPIPTIYIEDVEIVGIRFDRSTRYGLENMSTFPISTARVGRYTAPKILYPPDYPWPYPTNEPIASYGTSFTTYGATGPLAPFDGMNDGAMSLIQKPDGNGGYWGGGSTSNSPDDLNLFVPSWQHDGYHQWFRGRTYSDGREYIELMLNVKGYWWFYDNDEDATTDPLPPGHWYWWEDRISVSVAEPPEAIIYFYTVPTTGEPRTVTIPLGQDPTLPLCYDEGPALGSRALERRDPDPIVKRPQDRRPGDPGTFLTEDGAILPD